MHQSSLSQPKPLFFKVENLQNIGKWFSNLDWVTSSQSPVPMLSSSIATAKWTRAIDRLRNPRRLALTALACIMALLWLGQALLGIFLRAQATESHLLKWIPFSLSAYLVWNIVRTIGQRPVVPFEWTAAEREWLLAKPIDHQQIIRFRILTIGRSALIKSIVFTILMLPDLNVLAYGFLAMYIGLMSIEVARIACEVAVYSMTKFERLLTRLLVLGSLAILFLQLLATTSIDLILGEPSSAFGGIHFLSTFLSHLMAQANTTIGQIITWPFNALANAIVTDKLNLTSTLTLLIGMAAISIGNMLLPAVDRWCKRRIVERERREFPARLKSVQPSTNVGKKIVGNRPPHLLGVGGLSFRQSHGAWHYRNAVAVSLLVPSILSCMPAFIGVTGFNLVVNTVGALAFYSLVLIPASLKFDFRRDVDRLHLLKSIPVNPVWVVVGQLSVPLALVTLFQFFSLGFVWLISPFEINYFGIGLLLLIPVNLFIFSFENLVFLLYPYRLTQEGIQVLMRSILVFTAKSVLFGAGFIGAYLWVVTSKFLADEIFASQTWLTTGNLFFVGFWTVLMGLGLATFWMTVRAFEKFDLCRDLSGLD